MRRTNMIALTVIALSLMMAWMVPAQAVETQRVNINTAGYQELMTLERVGEAYAKRIVAYREKNGPFKTAEDLLMVQGIGPKIIEVNAHRIVVKEE